MALSNQKIQDRYSDFSKIYDLLFGPIFHKGRKKIIEKMSILPNQKILEVGVGTGLSLELYPEHSEVHGIDLTESMLAKAQLRVQEKNLSWVKSLQQMDALNMSFESQTFDKVAAMYVASVVPSVETLLSEMKRVCKPGGDLFFVNHFTSENSFVKWCETKLNHYSDLFGFHTDFPMEPFLEKVALNPVSVDSINVYWTLVHFRNETS